MNNGLDTLTRSIKLGGLLITKTALHVGSARSIDPIESDNPVMKDIDGRPLIPGSSLKGVIRSTLETTLRGMGATIVCSPSDNDYCVERKIWGKPSEVLEKACPVCRLFGAPYLASKILFEDLTVNGDWSDEYYVVRDGVTIDRDSRTAAHGKKFDFETIPPGVSFNLSISIKNPEDYEIGMLALAFELINNGLVHMGGNTSRGLGKVEIQIREAQEITQESIKKFFDGESNSIFEVRDWDELKKLGLAALKEKLPNWKKQ